MVLNFSTEAKTVLGTDFFHFYKSPVDTVFNAFYLTNRASQAVTVSCAYSGIQQQPEYFVKDYVLAPGKTYQPLSTSLVVPKDFSIIIKASASNAVDVIGSYMQLL